MNKLILFLFTLSTLIYTQCDNLTEYPCALNPECKWTTENTQGECNDLSEEQCKSGQYNYCYWSSNYSGNSECLGGSYSKSAGYCESSDNVLNDYLSSTVDQALILLLTSAGLEYTPDGTMKVFNDNYDDFKIYYETIELSYNGFKIVNPGITIYEARNTITDLQFDYISLNITLDQFIYIVGELINNESLGKIEDITIKGSNAYLTQTNESQYIEWARMEAKLGLIEFNFNGYINQKIINDIDKQIRIPDMNQVLSGSLKDFEIVKMIDDNGTDLLLQTLEMVGMGHYRNELYKIHSITSSIKYLPENNKIEFEGKIKHPFLTSSATQTTDIEFNFTNPDNSKFLSTNQNFTFEFKLPNNKDLDLKKLDLDHLEASITRLPDNVFFSFDLKYDDLHDLLIQLNSPMDDNFHLNRNAYSKISFNIDNLSFQIADVESLQNRSYNSQQYRTYNNFNIDLFKGDIIIQNNAFTIDTDLYSDMCNIEGNVDIDIYDLTKPWINKALFTISNISNKLEPYITLLETNIQKKFPRKYNSIILDIIGYLDKPEIKDMEPIKQRRPSGGVLKDTNPNLKKEFMDACMYTNGNSLYCDCAYPLYEKYGPSKEYVIEVDRQCLYLKY